MSKKNIYLSINHTKFTSPNNKTATLSLFHISGDSSPLKHEQNIVIPWNKAHYNASGIILFKDYERRLTDSSLKEHPHKKPNIIIPEGNIEKVDQRIKGAYQTLAQNFSLPSGKIVQETDIIMQNHIRLNILGENLKGKAWGLKVLMPYLSPATTAELNELNAAFNNTIPLVAFLFELDEEINSMRYALIPIDHESLPEEYRYK